MNVWDVILTLSIVAAVVAAVIAMRRSCARTGCASCPFAEGCVQRGEAGCDVRTKKARHA